MDDRNDTRALFVRLPAEHARRLHQAANALSTPKKDIVAGLVDRYVRPDDANGLETLRAMTRPRRIEIDLGEAQMTVGQHSFRPNPPAEVLDARQASELLAVDEQAVVELAEGGELPGRKIAGEWRFSRRAVLEWLSGGVSGA